MISGRALGPRRLGWNSATGQNSLWLLEDLPCDGGPWGMDAQPCPPWSLGCEVPEGRLLGGSLLRAVVRITLAATLDGDIYWGRGIEMGPEAHPIAWLASELGLLSGWFGQGQHRFHMSCLETRTQSSVCPWLGPTARQRFWAWAQPLRFCRPSLVSHVDGLSLVDLPQACGMFCSLFL